MVAATIGAFFGGWALEVAKDKVGDAVDQRLSGDSIKEAIQQAVSAADGEVPELFARYERQGLRGTERFLNGAFREVAIAQLQKPLQDDGKPDDALLAQVFLREAKSHSKLKDISEEGVAAWMQAFTDAYFQTTTQFLKFQVVQTQYYRQLRSKTGKVVFSGMAVDGTVVDEPGELARIFVMPDVQRQREQGYELGEMPAIDIAEDAQKRVLWEQQQQFLLKKERVAGTTSVSAVELLKAKDEKRVVILGAPGAGKTTLMNYWVVMATSAQGRAESASDVSSEKVSSERISSDALFGTGRCLPMLIRIRDLVREPDLSVLDFLIKFAKADLEVAEIPTDFFQHWLKRGEALILLDGLDEVADDAQRHKVVEKIETFLRAYEDCPAIITSRPAGYRDDYFSRKQYPHYELLPFDDEKIETFINYWYDSRVDLQTERERRKESLREALTKKPRIKQLARNPLLLTMIALIHRYRTLPRQRHELYNCAVETLISTWDKEKELTTNSELKYLNLPDIRRLMERLAYWIHAQGSVSDTENGTQIERGAMVEQLAKFIKEVKASEQLQLYQAEAEAKTLLDKIVKDRAGLLAKQGENRYAFVHKTFQEYLCSQEILYLQKDQDPDDDDYVPYTKQHIKQYLHDPHWREVLLLLVAQQTPIPAKGSLKTILKAESEYEQWLHRDVLFAGSCLAENAEVSDQGIIDEILTELVSLETSLQLSSSSKVRGEVFLVITNLQDTPFALAVMKRLVICQPPIEQQLLIDYHCKLEPSKAIQRLLQLAQDDDADKRSRAALWLRQLESSDVAIEALITLLEDSDAHVRSCAAESLGRLGQSSELIVETLVVLLKDDNADVRYHAAESLVQLGQSSGLIVETLVALLRDDSLALRALAATSLGELSQSSESIVRNLVALLKDDDADVRYNAAASLGWLSQPSELVVEALVALLKDDDEFVRHSAAASLRQLGQPSESIINVIFALLKNDDVFVRSDAAKLLGQLDQSSELIVDTLVALLRDDSASVRHNAAESLGQLNQSSELILDALVVLLRDDNAFVRCGAAKALGQLSQSLNGIIETLINLLEDDSFIVLSMNVWGNVNDRAAESLIALAQKSDTVKPALVQWIEQHQHEAYVGKGIDVLWELTS